MDIEYLSRNKERYFKKAEKYIRKAGLKEVLQVNRNTIGLYQNQAKVYILPPLKKDTGKKIWKQALTMKDFHEIPYKKRYGDTQTFYRGYFLFHTRKTENIKKRG